MLIEMATIAQSRKDRLRLKLVIRDDAPDRRQHRQAVGGCCAQGMRARVQLRKILHLLLPRAGPGASHAHAHPNRLPKLRPHRRHVSDVAAYLGVLAVRARGLHQARQPGEIADRDAGGEGGGAGCVGSLRSDGGRGGRRNRLMPSACGACAPTYRCGHPIKAYFVSYPAACGCRFTLFSSRIPITRRRVSRRRVR